MIRWLQVENTIIAATVLSVGVGLLWLLFSGAARRRKMIFAGVVAAVLAVAGLSIPRWDPILINSGPFLYAGAFEEDLRQGADIRELLHNNFDVLFHEDGVEATVSVLEQRASGERDLRINGKTDASSTHDMPTQVLLAHLPVLLHPSPRKVMILGLASGVTSGSVLFHPVDRVDCVEISPSVARASVYFNHVNELDLGDDRFNLIMDDARNYLSFTDVRYDVIILEPTNAWVAGMSTLYTREFYGLISSRLEPGGLVLIFLPIYDLDARTTKMVFRTIHEVFPYATLWESIPLGDYFIIASNARLKPDLARLRARGSAPAVAADLKRVYVHGGEELFARFVMGPDRFSRLIGDGPVHTDDRRRLEYIIPKLQADRENDRSLDVLRNVLAAHEPATVLFDDLDDVARDLFSRFNTSRMLFYRAVSISGDRQYDYQTGELIIQSWRNALGFSKGRYPGDYASMNLAALLIERARVNSGAGAYDVALADWEEAFALDPDDSSAADRLVEYYLKKGEADLAGQWAHKALERAPRDARALAALGDLALIDGAPDQAEQYFLKGMESFPRNPEFQWKLGLALAQQGRLAESEARLKQLIKNQPDFVEPMFLLYEVLVDQGKRMEAKRYLEKVERTAPGHPLFEQLKKKGR
jgi:spermidine synthase/tetratricopeptide (TPR) repeat protein